MNKKIIIIFSSGKEANSFIYQSDLKFEKINRNEYQHNNIIVCITGIGKKAVERINLNRFKDIAFVIKTGACAVLDKNVPLCKTFVPLIVRYKTNDFKVDFSKLPEKVHKLISVLTTNKTLLTQDEALFDEKKASDLFGSGISFVDMETYFIIETFRNVPVIPLVVGTDRGGRNAKKDFLKMLPVASSVLKDELVKLTKFIY